MASSSIQLPISPVSMMPFPNLQLSWVASGVKPFGLAGLVESSLQGSPAREEGEVPESELDPDTRRTLLILQHGQDMRLQISCEPPFPVRPPKQVSVPRGSWFLAEEEMSLRQLGPVASKEFSLDSEPMHFEKHRPLQTFFFPKAESPIPSDRNLQENQKLPEEAFQRDDRIRLDRPMPYLSFSVKNLIVLHLMMIHLFIDKEIPLVQTSLSNRDTDFESGQAVSDAETSAGVLQEIAMKFEAKVEFRPTLVASTEMQFSIEIAYLLTVDCVMVHVTWTWEEGSPVHV